MEQDQHTYKRAADAALIGLITHVVLFIVVGLTGVYAKAPSIHIATWYLMGGIPVWVMLWMLLNQHRIERVEALEEEQLARADAKAAAIFDSAGEQLRTSRRRLETMQRLGLPLVSLLLSVYLLVLGGWYLYRHRNLFRIEGYEKTLFAEGTNVDYLAFLFILGAVVAFLVGRYLAGMTQVKAWQALRGGASTMMGVVLVLSLLGAASVASIFGNAIGFALVQVGLPIIMLLLGVEIALGLLLGMYRPRRAGEDPRPAFDSRVLGWLTRPESIGQVISETINYQFGFEISRSWFYQLLSRAMVPLTAASVLLLLGMSCIVLVSPQEQAVITSFGRLDRVADPGLTFKLPWPLGRAEKYETARVQQVIIGSRILDDDPEHARELLEKPILWTNQHTEGQEQFIVTAPTQLPAADGSGEDAVLGELIGGDIDVKFRIADLKRYVSSTAEPRKMVQALAERAMGRYFATQRVDTLLTTARGEAGEVLKAAIQRDVDRFNMGIEIVFVGVSGIHPPQTGEVADKFHEVIDAFQEQQTFIAEARRDAARVLASAAGSEARALELAAALEDLRLARLARDTAADGEAREEAAKRVTELEQQIEAAITGADERGAIGGEATRLIQRARAYRWQRAIGEVADAQRFSSELQAYQAAPRYYMHRAAIDAVAESLTGRPKTVIDGDPTVDPEVWIDLKDSTSRFQGLLPDE